LGDILCIGGSHHPGFSYPDENFADILRNHLKSPRIPAEAKDPDAGPAAMVREFGREGENATAQAKLHREHVINAYRQMRQAVLDFKPDFLLVWGDDQYENFREDLIPPFCTFIMDEFVNKPWESNYSRATNIWNEPKDTVRVSKSQPEAAKYLIRRLLEEGIPIPYSYKGHHHQGLAHAFLNTVNYLDYDRKGFNVPFVPFHVNCYGSSVVRNRGGDTLSTAGNEPDPPAPSPRVCYDVGAAVARILRDSPYRAVLMGSSSWSHAFLTKKHNFLWPDVEADRARYEDLKSGDFRHWRDLNLAQIEESGQHELLNWVCLAGAMDELGLKPTVIDYSETYIFNSSKCAIIAGPALAKSGKGKAAAVSAG